MGPDSSRRVSFLPFTWERIAAWDRLRADRPRPLLRVVCHDAVCASLYGLREHGPTLVSVQRGRREGEVVRVDFPLRDDDFRPAVQPWCAAGEHTVMVTRRTIRDALRTRSRTIHPMFSSEDVATA